ncbi:hypothetical protein QQP08_020783 [Theobroma cacao]|nr:hypothetical protein QQP08_020783 [Theobroma cacao]
MQESRSIINRSGKGNKSLPESDVITPTGIAEEETQARYARKALFCLKNLIERSACKLKRNFLANPSSSSSKKKKSDLKRACCACISSEKRTPLTNGLFKVKSFLLKGGGDGGSKGNNGGKNGKGANDKKKQK